MSHHFPFVQREGRFFPLISAAGTFLPVIFSSRDVSSGHFQREETSPRLTLG